MGDTHHDPTDHSRTTQPHAGIAMKDNFFWPGFILLAVAVFGMISTVAAAAYRHYEWLATTVLSPCSERSLERYGSSWSIAV